jgi:hypothetical protein
MIMVLHHRSQRRRRRLCQATHKEMKTQREALVDFQ